MNRGIETMLQTKEPVLEINGLQISFIQYERGLRRAELTVIRDLDVTVRAGELTAVVGSSGSGKSLLAHAVLGILPYNASYRGSIRYRGQELTPQRAKSLRGSEIVLVPQSVSYLDPLMKVGPQIRRGSRKADVCRRLDAIFERLGLKKETENQYPFQLSGGMNRRVLLSSAWMEAPGLVIADEPTPGLDLPVAKRVMEDFRALADKGAAVLVITHDLELALETADRITVFYAGSTVEEAKASDFEREELLRHPYTKALWRAMPKHGFSAIPGTQPYAKEVLKGCPFRARCGMGTKECEGEIPYRKLREGRVRCIWAR